ncbi:MFS transporter [Rubrobacter calidifluminis]|uniref:MFS transporter n=1 Tax=Rubrobacter calidifluminis TaxID=1392640 RepID=UPI00235F4892|nr:MFS transporter [Rubrobacter calidifluminis]
MTTKGVERRRLRWAVAVVVLAANTMDILDATIVNVAAPSVHQDLGGSTSSVQWLSAGYTLAFAVLLVTAARLGDIFGRRRIFLAGLAGFTLTSAACAVAPNVVLLIGARVLQGGFGALMLPQSFGLIKEVFDDEEIVKVTNLFGPSTGLAMLGAPVLAGALIDADLWGIGWRLVFLINVPIGLLALPLALCSLPRSISHPGLRLDIWGVWLIGLALVAIIYPLIQGRSEGWPMWTLALFAVGVVLLYTFVHYERTRCHNALIEPALFTNRDYLSGIAIVLCIFGAFGGLLFCISLYGQLGEGWSAIRSGLALTPMVVGMILGMPASSTLARRIGRRVLYFGTLLMASGVLVLSGMLTVGWGGSMWSLFPGLFLVGAGAGATFGQLFQFVLNSVSMEEVGSASGIMDAAEQLSTALGVAVLGTIFFALFQHPGDALRVTALACLPSLGVALVFVSRLPVWPDSENN